MKIATRGIVGTAAALLIAGALSACSAETPEPQETTGPGTSNGASGTIALLLPESQTTRYEAFDRPFFEERFMELCPDCTIVYANADGDASRQQDQADSVLSQDIKVLVLDPVDSAAAASIVAQAASMEVPVIAYDRLIRHPDLALYVSFDNEAVGALQGTALVQKMEADGKGDGNILMINGSPTDNNAGAFKSGAHSVIDASNLTVLAEFDTPDWAPTNAQDWAAGQIVQFGDQIDGIYAANDGTGGGAIAALRAAGVDPLPPVTGQDAELSAIQRIITGDQYMTVYKAIKAQAYAAAEAAFALLQGEEPNAPHEVDGVPSLLLDPVSVTIDNIMATVVADGFYTVEDICTAEYAAACADAGIG
ncbi:MAG: ABC transporter substrate-binding protein [Actinobacteria bacterium HGW-Actinobacteria-4]|nr:MAG: ABC transporter substrate-binding protein [Actinobacteria bacterium HGW-Actinobacteria-4]